MKHSNTDKELLFGAWKNFYAHYIFFEDCYCERGIVKDNDLYSYYAKKQCPRCHDKYRGELVKEGILKVSSSLFPASKGIETKILIDDWKTFQEQRKEKIKTCRIGDMEQKFCTPEEGIERRQKESTPKRNVFRKRQKGEEGKIIVQDFIVDRKCAAMVISKWEQVKFIDDIPEIFIDGIKLYELVNTSTREAAQEHVSRVYGGNLKNYWMENA